jgi:hypothetical protein
LSTPMAPSATTKDPTPSGYVCHVFEEITGAAYIGRENRRYHRGASKFYNPYRIGDPHDSIPRGEVLDRITSLSLYYEYLKERPFLLRQLPDLRGKPLECWCRRSYQERTKDNRCHGDVLLWLLKTYTDEELKAMT